MCYGRSGFMTSDQVGIMGVIDLTKGDVSFKDIDPLHKTEVVNIKNDGPEDIDLEVWIGRMKDSEHPIKTTFYRGWNAELVRKIKAHPDAASFNLKYGY